MVLRLTYLSPSRLLRLTSAGQYVNLLKRRRNARRLSASEPITLCHAMVYDVCSS